MMSDKKQLYIDKIEAQLREWAAQLDMWGAQADQAKADAKLHTNANIERLQAERDQLNLKLAEVKAAGEESWEELKLGVDKAWESLKGAFAAATK